MTGYSTHWWKTILASIAFHFFIALGFAYALPHLAPEPPIKDVTEFEWVDVDLLPPDVVVIDAEAIPAEAVQETLPIFNAQDLFIPELPIPEPVLVEEPPPPPEIKPIERPQPSPQVIKDEPETKPQVKNEEPPKEVIAPANNNQRMERPPITIMEVYPEKGSGLGYKGYVSIAVTIGKDGKVKSTQIVQSSGRLFVDEIARKAAVQWTFKPALDKIGKPMVCDKIITFDFKKFS